MTGLMPIFSPRSVTLTTVTLADFSTSSGADGSGSTFFVRGAGVSLTNGWVIRKIGVYSTSARTLSVHIALRNSSTSYTVVVHETGKSHPGGGWADFQIASDYTVPGTGEYNAGVYSGTSWTDNTASVGRAFYASADASGTIAVAESTNVALPLRVVRVS